MAAIKEIQEVLSSKFIYSEGFAEAISLAMVADFPVLFYGSGGHGKSEMVLEVFKLLQCSWGMLECNPGTSASDIYGGAVAKTTKKENEEVTKASYFLENSLLKNKAFFLEEVLDADWHGLAALKSLITLKGTNLDGKFIPSENKVLVAATNIHPKELLDTLPETYKNSFEALLQRFLIVKHEWQEYKPENYLDLVKLIEKDKNSKLQKPINFSLQDVLALRELADSVKIPQEIQEVLCVLAHKSEKVSPRTFAWAIRLLKANAAIDGRGEVSQEDLKVLKYITSFSIQELEGIKQELERIQTLKKVERQLSEIRRQLEDLTKLNKEVKQLPNGLEKVQELGKLQKNIEVLEEKLDELQIPDSLECAYKHLEEVVKNLAYSNKKLIVESVLSV